MTNLPRATEPRPRIPSLTELIDANRMSPRAAGLFDWAPPLVPGPPPGEPTVVEDGLRDLYSGEPMLVLAGTGHTDEAILAAAEHAWGDFNGLERLEVIESAWGWTPRFKHCANNDTGWPCDDEGQWHRHYSPTAGSGLRTAVFGRSQPPQALIGDVRRIPLSKTNRVEVSE